MILLGLDTCGDPGTLALARAEAAESLEPLGEATLAGRTTAAELVPSLRRMLEESSVELSRIDGIVAVDGPGSFTGIRIGLSAAKALAEALGKPLFAISRLRVLAHSREAAGAVLDAGRGEFYVGSFPRARPAGSPVQLPDAQLPVRPAEQVLTREELQALLASYPDRRYLACEVKVASVFPQLLLVPPPTALDAILAATVTSAPEGPGRPEAADLAALDGRYLRRSDLYRPAERSLSGSR